MTRRTSGIDADDEEVVVLAVDVDDDEKHKIGL